MRVYVYGNSDVVAILNGAATCKVIYRADKQMIAI